METQEKSQVDCLSEIFSNVDPRVVSLIYSENKGDIESCVSQLSSLAVTDSDDPQGDQGATKKKKKRRRRKRNKNKGGENVDQGSQAEGGNESKEGGNGETKEEEGGLPNKEEGKEEETTTEAAQIASSSFSSFPSSSLTPHQQDQVSFLSFLFSDSLDQDFVEDVLRCFNWQLMDSLDYLTAHSAKQLDGSASMTDSMEGQLLLEDQEAAAETLALLAEQEREIEEHTNSQQQSEYQVNFQVDILMSMFPTMQRDILAFCLEENGNDLEKTTEKLLEQLQAPVEGLGGQGQQQQNGRRGRKKKKKKFVPASEFTMGQASANQVWFSIVVPEDLRRIKKQQEERRNMQSQASAFPCGPSSNSSSASSIPTTATTKSCIAKGDWGGGGGAQLSNQFKLEALISKFSHAPPDVIESLWEFNKFDLNKTLRQLQKLFPTEASRKEKRKQKLDEEEQKSSNDGPSFNFVQVPTPSYNANLSGRYEEYRELAAEYAVLRNQCFAMATRAYIGGAGAKAKEMSARGRQYDALMKEQHALAASALFAGPYLSGIDNLPEIDLHGLHIDEAMHLLDALLKENKAKIPTSTKYRSLSVITGIGKHSMGKAKLRPAVRKYLLSNRYKFSEDMEGRFIVRVQ